MYDTRYIYMRNRPAKLNFALLQAAACAVILQPYCQTCYVRCNNAKNPVGAIYRVKNPIFGILRVTAIKSHFWDFSR